MCAGSRDDHAPESFHSLLLRHRGRTGLIQRELAIRAGVSQRSVQDWESGVTVPSAERLRGLLRALLEARGLTPGQELAEAHALWEAAQSEGSRMNTPFDAAFFADLLATDAPPATPEPVRPSLVDRDAGSGAGRPVRAQDWGDAPDSADFVGRTDELSQLQDWVLADRRRLVAVLGIGGIGKTTLAAKLAQIVTPAFERVYWRSLRNAPPVSDWLAGVIGFLSDERQVTPATESEQISAL